MRGRRLTNIENEVERYVVYANALLIVTLFSCQSSGDIRSN